MSFAIARRPRGRYAKVWADVLRVLPDFEGASAYVDIGDHLQVEVGHGLVGRGAVGAPEWRRGLVERAAEHFQVPVRAMASDRAPRKVTHWCTAPVGGVCVIFSAVACECHDGLEATLGHFESQDDVVAEAAGTALRQLLPPEHHAGIGAAEALIDAVRAVRSATDGR